MVKIINSNVLRRWGPEHEDNQRPLQQQDQLHDQQEVENQGVKIEPNESNANGEVWSNPSSLSVGTHKDATASIYSPHSNVVKTKGYWSDPEIRARDRPMKAPGTHVREMKEACGSRLMREILHKSNRFKNEELRLLQCSNVVKIETRPFDPLTYKNLELEKGHFMKPMTRYRKVKDVTPKTEKHALPVTLEDGNPRWVASNARFMHWSDGGLQWAIGDQYFNLEERDPGHQRILCKHEEDILETQPESELRPITASLPFESKVNLLPPKLDSKVQTVKMHVPTLGPEKESRARARAESRRLRRERVRSEETQRTKEKLFKDVGYLTEGCCRLRGSKSKPEESDEKSPEKILHFHPKVPISREILSSLNGLH